MFHCDDLKKRRFKQQTNQINRFKTSASSQRELAVFLIRVEQTTDSKTAESVETNLQKRRGKENKAVTANIPIRRWTKPND